MDDSGDHPTLIAIARAPWIIQPSSCARLQAHVRAATGQQVTLRIWTARTRHCDANGFLWEKVPPDKAAAPAVGDGISTGEVEAPPNQ